MDSQKFVTSTLLIAGEPVRFVASYQPDLTTSAYSQVATAEALRKQLRRIDHATPHHAWLWNDSEQKKTNQSPIRLIPSASKIHGIDALIAASIFKAMSQLSCSEIPFNRTTYFDKMQCRIHATHRNKFRCQVEPVEINLPGEKQLVGIPGLGLVNLTKLFADDFYIVAQMRELGIRSDQPAAIAQKLEDFARMILQAASLSFNFTNPKTREETQPHAVIFVYESDNHLTQAVVYAGCQPDRSPGIIPSAITAALYQPLSASVIVRGITGDEIILNQIINKLKTDYPSIGYSLLVDVELIEEGVLYVNEM